MGAPCKVCTIKPPRCPKSSSAQGGSIGTLTRTFLSGTAKTPAADATPGAEDGPVAGTAVGFWGYLTAYRIPSTLKLKNQRAKVIRILPSLERKQRTAEEGEFPGQGLQYYPQMPSMSIGAPNCDASDSERPSPRIDGGRASARSTTKEWSPS